MDLFKLENTSVSGNPVVLEDCSKAPLQGLTVYGKSTQVTTTGAQLFVSEKSQESLYGMTLTQKDDGGWHLGGTCTADNSRNIRLLEPTEYFTLPSGDYTLSFTGAIPNSVTLNIAKVANVHKQNEQWTHLGGINKNKRNLAISLDGTEEALSMYVIFPAQVALSFDFYVMLNAGDTALPWEPYTGGKPSPSPDYPQEIQSAKSEVVVRGKNLFGGRYYYANYANSILIINGNKKEEVKLPYAPEYESFGVCKTIKCKKGKTYVISVTNPNKNATIGMAEYENIKNASAYTKNVGFADMSNKTKQLYTAKSDGILVCGIAGIWTDGKTTLHECTESELLQVEEASEATSYEPYHTPQTLTLSTPNGLPGVPVTSGGNYTDENGQQWICDELDFAGGVYRQRIYSIIVDGVDVGFSQEGPYCNINLREMPSAKAVDASNQRAATKSTFTSEPWNFNQEYGFLYLVKENYAEILNESCKKHNGEIIYALATPIETPLTQSQIETYKSLRTYNGTTIIESPDSAGLSAVYGRKIFMANTTLKTRIILNNKTTDEWAQAATFVGLKGEFLVDSSTRKIKIGDGATAYPDLPFVNLTPEEVDSLIKAASHSHNNKDVLDATTASFTTALLEKLNGIATGANKTVVDSALSSTSTNPVQNKVVQAALDGKVPTTRKVNGKALSGDITLSAGDVGAIATTARGAKNGVASLDENGKVPAAQLPSYVDDVLEGYVADDLSAFYKDSGKTSAYTPETGKIYVDLNNNKTYRYSGSKYTVISETLALGETSSTAFDGARGKKAYDHSQSAHAPSNAERNIIVGVQKNGADVTVDSNRKVNITVPTKTSQITNDSGFITSGATTAKAKQLETARKIDGVNFNGTTDITHYGTCSTAAGTAAKTVAVTGFNLVTGARVTVKFTVTNTAASPTLNVNGTGAKAIKYRGSTINTGYLAANRVYEFVYDGTDYLFMGDINTDSNTTYSAGSGLQLSGTQFKHKNAVTAGTAKGDDNKTLSFGGTFKVPSVSYDTEGHITGSSSTTMTMPAAPTSVSGNAGSATKLANARNFSITGGATAAAVSFNGTSDVSLNVTSLNAAKLALAEGDTLILDGSV
jgi:hypothetical protein